MSILTCRGLCLVFLVILLSCLGISSVKGAEVWPDKEGELCWKNNEGDIIKLSIENMREKHYLAHGTYTHTGSGGYIRLLDGNAEIIGNQIIMNLSSSRCDASKETICASTGTVELDSKTLDGSTSGVSYYYEKKTGKSGINYDGPTKLVNIPCAK